jgi:CRISPR-associated endonuclease/helicase Cas3
VVDSSWAHIRGDGSDRFIAWGKLHRDGAGKVHGTHPLLDHMLDVSACFLALVETTAIRRALETAAGRPLDVNDLDRLAALTFLHDIGKANSGFQSRYWQAPDRPPPTWPTAPCGHGPEGWALVTGAVANAELLLSGLPLEQMATWGAEAADKLLHASISHHGRPIGEGQGGQSQTEVVWRPVVSKDGSVLYDPRSTITRMGVVLAQAFPKAFEADASLLPDSPAFAHLFAGLVQAADWLGSDTRDGFFPYTAPGEDRIETAPARARQAVKSIGLDVDVWRLQLERSHPDFAQAFGVPSPRPMQAALGDLTLGPLVILEAETGSGKTEAALWRFLQLFRAGQVDSLYFALPTRVAATQLYKRVCDVVARVWPANAPVVVRALPGYEAADGSQKISLPDFKVLWADKPSDAVSHLRWAAESPKRFLAASIAVGTIDQVLLGALQVKHAHMRQAMLSRSLLVIDEVHASDEYMTALLEQLLQGHLLIGGQALLLSATLGAVARTKYLSVGLKRPGLPPSLADASLLPYPAISFRSGRGAQLREVAGNPAQKVVHWQTLDAIDDPDRIAAIVVDAAAQGARVLVIRNTVPAATATLQAIERRSLEVGGDWLFTVAGVRTLHHSRFSKQDRPLLDQAVEDQLGKVRAGLQGRIVVGTQTLEQSLDIDADLLITDLCPMDVLLQRVGRLHRHQRPDAERPEAFRAPRTWVLTPSADDLSPLLKRAKHGLGPMRSKAGGIEGVYPDLRILEATRRLVVAQSSREIPSANRVLVEQATHPEALLVIEQSCGEAWQQLGQSIEGTDGAHRSIAYLHRLDTQKPFGEEFRGSDEKIATRLGAADRLLTFPSAPMGPFGQTVVTMALRFHQAPSDLAADAGPEKVVAMGEEPGFEFDLGDTRYRYSRLGLQRLSKNETGEIK